MVIDKPHPLETFTIAFLFLSISGFEILWNIPRPSSQKNHMLDLLVIDASLFKTNEPYKSQTSAPSQKLIATSKTLFPDFLTHDSEL